MENKMIITAIAAGIGATVGIQKLRKLYLLNRIEKYIGTNSSEFITFIRSNGAVYSLTPDIYLYYFDKIYRYSSELPKWESNEVLIKILRIAKSFRKYMEEEKD